MTIGLDQINRIRASLLTSGVQRTNNALYQSILGLIQVITAIDNAIPGSGLSGTTIINQFLSSGIGGFDGEDGLDGIGVPGINGITGSQGPIGPVFYPEDGIDGLDGMSIPVPGQAGSNGATGSTGAVGVSIFPFDGLDGEDGFPGPPGANGSPSSSGVQIATLDLTNTNFDNGNSTPLDILAAQGANKIIIPLSVVNYSNVTVTKAANPTMRIRWNGDTTDLTGSAITMQLNSTGEWLRAVTMLEVTVSLALASFDPRNKSIQWSLSANTSTGNATGKIRLAYFVADLN